VNRNTQILTTLERELIQVSAETCASYVTRDN
jgi:hypothetical protein